MWNSCPCGSDFFTNQSSKYHSSIFAHLCFQYLLAIRYANAPDTINTKRHAHFHLFAKMLSDEQGLGLPPPVLSKAVDAKDTATAQHLHANVSLCTTVQLLKHIMVRSWAIKWGVLKTHDGEQDTNAVRHSSTLVRPSSKIRWLHRQLQIYKKAKIWILLLSFPLLIFVTFKWQWSTEMFLYQTKHQPGFAP